MKNKDLFGELETFKRLNAAGVHVYYLFGKRIMIGNPDGLIKEITLPVNGQLYKKYLEFEEECPKWFTLESGARAISHEYRKNAEIFLAKDGKLFAKSAFPVIVITVFYKHLFELLVKMKEHGLLRDCSGKGSISGVSCSLVDRFAKIYRPVVATPGDANPRFVTRIYKGVPENGYDEFWIGEMGEVIKENQYVPFWNILKVSC